MQESLALQGKQRALKAALTAAQQEARGLAGQLASLQVRRSRPGGPCLPGPLHLVPSFVPSRRSSGLACGAGRHTLHA